MHTEEVTQLLSQLVAIDSVNPTLAPGGRGEAELAQFAAGWMEARGLETRLEATADPQRPNVIGIARGSGGGRSLLLNAHLDTVGVVGMEHPHDPEVRAGRLYGRGAQDTKSSLAAFMLAAAEAKRLNLRGDVIVAGVADEEYASLGSEALVQTWQADAAIVGEPTDLNLAVAHKGFTWLEVETTGVAAHGSRPQEGVDAIAKMGRFLAALEDQAGDLSRAAAHPLLGHGSVHAWLITGGEEMSTYPARCRLSLERRTLPGETAAGVLAETQRLLDQLAAQDPAFKATARLTFERLPLEAPADAPIVRLLQRSMQAVLGRAVQPAGVSFWTDAAILSAAGIPTVVLGPVGGGLHGAVEWVDLESVRQCAEITLAAIRDFCS
jgi:acetylornithine deacetylase